MIRRTLSFPRTLALLVGLSIGVTAAANAHAGGDTVETDFRSATALVDEREDLVAYGSISSSRNICEGFRATFLTAVIDGRRQDLDFGFTSFNGAWSVRVPDPGVDEVRIVVPRQKILTSPRKNKTIICGAARIEVPVSRP